MHITKQKRTWLLLLAALLMHGCGGGEDSEPELPYDPLDPDGTSQFELNLRKAPLALDEDMPEDIQIFWDNLCRNYSGRIELYQGEWKDRDVFLIISKYNCLLCRYCLLCMIRYSNGEPWDTLEKSNEVIRDFCYTSKNWKKIREYDLDAAGS
ncbi:MAG: hypothetical protein LBP64_05710 [Tannerella sp.]|jgi:hypothetical protein|nr:hypothetical protein [Tannerella sp.]